MKINGTAHCLFEQSGTFRDAFREYGIPAYCYDIRDDYGKTDYRLDLFEQIRRAYDRKPSIFDGFSSQDLLLAFFPCTYFEAMQSTIFRLAHCGGRKWTPRRRIEYALDRLDQRTENHRLLYQLTAVCQERRLRLIIENPASHPGYLLDGCNFPAPTIVDHDRSRRGDAMKKPTAYWFINCKPTQLQTLMANRGGQKLRIKSLPAHSKERSELSPAYARNFIGDFILGTPRENTQLNLF